MYKDLDDKNKVKEEISKLQTHYTTLAQTYKEINKDNEPKTIKLSGTLKSKDKKSYTIKDVELKTEVKNSFEEEMAFAKKSYDTVMLLQNKIIEKAQAGIDLYHQIKDEKFEVYTDAIQVNGDGATLSPSLKFANGKVAHQFSDIALKTYGGWKVDFSSGYLLSFAGDDNYSIYKDAAGKTIGVKESNSHKFSSAIGALAHVYSRWERGPAIGLSAGASIAANESLGFYGGLSMLFLEQNRLVFTVGYAGNKLKKLNTANLNTSNVFITETDTEIKYDDIYKGSIFIGLTYNIFKKK